MRLHPEDDHILGANETEVVGGIHVRDLALDAFRSDDAETIAPDRLEVLSQRHQHHVVARFRQPTTHEPADRSRSGDAHTHECGSLTRGPLTVA